MVHLQIPTSFPPPPLHSVISTLQSDLASLGLPPRLDEAPDYYGDFPKDHTTSYLRTFEREVSSTLGKEDGVFMPSGVMAQSIALMINSRASSSNSFCCHKSSHLLIHEADSYTHLLNMSTHVIDTESPISFEDVRSILDSGSTELPHTIILEHPHRELGGQLTAHDDLAKIKALCSEKVREATSSKTAN